MHQGPSQEAGVLLPRALSVVPWPRSYEIPQKESGLIGLSKGEQMAQKSETRQMYAVVCRNLHVSFAPFRTKADADRYAETMNQYARRNAVENGRKPEDSCVYVSVVMWIQVIDEEPEGVVEYDKNAPRRKMN